MINLLHLPDGARLHVKGGGLVEIVENMQDGQWLMVRWLAAPKDPGLVGTEELLHADQILDVAEA